MPKIVKFNFDAQQKSFDALPGLKDLIKEELKDLDIPDETLEQLLAFSYCEGYKAALKDATSLLKSAGFNIVERP